jgi:iron complex outermembrane recepter protein
MTQKIYGNRRAFSCALALGALACMATSAWADDSGSTNAASASSSTPAAAAVAAPAATSRAGAPPAAAPASAEQTVAAPSGLQEVVVTAERREEAASKIPMSLSAVTQDQMDQLGVKDFQDLVRYMPGVNIDPTGTNAISIRGISSSAGAGTTGIYIDDTPIQMRDIGFNPDDTLPRTFDLERVEVLRGPQGTLFGSGSEGGTVRYILTQPSLTTSSTYVRTEASYTDYGDPSYEFGIAHGMPIIQDTLGIRASIWYRADGGWINKVDDTTGAVLEHNDNRDSVLMGRLAGLWQPFASLDVTLSMLYQRKQQHDEGTYWPAYSNPNAGVFDNATPELMPTPDMYYLPALKVEWDLGNTRLISNTSYYHRTEQTAYQGTVYDLGYFQTLGWPNNPLTGYLGIGCGPADNPGLAVTSSPCPWYPLIDGSGIHLPPGFTNYQTPNIVTNGQDEYIQELRWQSADPGAHLNWTVGLFWQLAKEKSIEQLQDTENNSFFEALYGQTYEQIVSGGNGYPSPFYSCPGQTPGYVYAPIPQCDIYYNRNVTFDRQIAGYGEASYAFTDQWKLTVGERVAYTKFSLDHYSDGLENYGPSPASADEHSTPNTPKASLGFQVDPNDLLYVSYAKGFRVGGGNAPLPAYCGPNLTLEGYPDGAPLTYRSDSTQNYEIGSKNIIGGFLKLATSAYWINWNDIQQNVYVGGTCGLQFTDNLGTAVAKGFDLQADFLFGPFKLDFSAGYTNARFTQNSPHGLAFAGDAISGQEAIEYAPGTNPPWTVSVGPEYDFKLASYDAFVRADWSFESRNNWLAPVQDPRSVQCFGPPTPAGSSLACSSIFSYSPPSHSFLQLRSGVNIGDWMVSVFCDNCINSHPVIDYQLGPLDPYNPAGTPSVQQNQYTYRPLTVGITATLHMNGGP